MVPESRKAYVLNIVRTGVDFFTACVLGRLSEDQIFELEEDEDFQANINFLKATEKADLVKKYKEIAKAKAEDQQDYNALRSLLKDFYPDAFATGEGGGSDSIVVEIPSNGRNCD